MDNCEVTVGRTETRQGSCFLNEFFKVLHITLAFVFTDCRYRSIVQSYSHYKHHSL